MRFESSLTDKTVLEIMGLRLTQARLDSNLTQAQIAEKAGLSKRTVERLEDGESAQLSKFIRVLRALDLLDGLDALLPETPPSPIEMAKLRGNVRQRASGMEPKHASKVWTWGDRKK